MIFLWRKRKGRGSEERSATLSVVEEAGRDEPENLLRELSEVELLVEDGEKLSHGLREMLEVLERLNDRRLGTWEGRNEGSVGSEFEWNAKKDSLNEWL